MGWKTPEHSDPITVLLEVKIEPSMPESQLTPLVKVATGVPPVNHAQDGRDTIKLNQYPFLCRSALKFWMCCADWPSAAF